eukprot:NODE_296_length_11478_cov_0.345197.p7 type:complete len:172 gc:universal NODE_296_length_11478_cov_0.345197:1504-2019(+)
MLKRVMVTTSEATFAAGCFWSIELVFQRELGVVSTKVGYTGGDLKNPTYEQVCSGETGHAEAVHLTYNPDTVTFERLLKVFWECHDPTQKNRQGNDIGTQYRSAIFYHSNAQKETAQKSKELQENTFKSKIATEIQPFSKFYDAEEYHQKYLEKGGQCSKKGSKDKIRCYG